jgi:hypothetical protein
MKSSLPRVSASRLPKLGTADALVDRRGEDDRAAAADDVERGDHALDRLVVRFVERKAGGRGDDDVGGAVEVGAHVPLHDAHPCGVRALEVAGEHAGELAAAVDRHVAEEVDADPPGDVEQLLMERVALDDAGPERRFEHCRAVQAAHGVDPRAARCHRFPSAREARHEVRLDQAGHDAEVGAEQPAIDPQLGAAAGATEMDVLARVARLVIADAIAPHDVGAGHRRQLVGGVGAMQPGRNEDLDPFGWHPRRLERGQQGRQHDPIRHRPRLVGDHHHRVAPAAGDLGQRRRPDRLRERRRHRPAGIRQRRSFRRLQHRYVEVVGQRDVQPRAPVVEANLHSSFYSTYVPIWSCFAADTPPTPERWLRHRTPKLRQIDTTVSEKQVKLWSAAANPPLWGGRGGCGHT